MKLFDDQFKKLLEDVKILVTNSNIQHAIDQVEFALQFYTLRHLKPDDFLVSSFNTYITVPYGEKIMNKDESFFLNLNSSDIVSDEFQTESNESITFLTSVFKDIWADIDEKTKKNIWKRMQILVKLCEKWQKERK